MRYPDGHARYRIVDAPEGGSATVLESFSSLFEAEQRLTALCDGDHDTYLMDAEDNHG